MTDKDFKELLLSMQEAGHLLGNGEFVDKSTPILIDIVDKKKPAKHSKFYDKIINSLYNASSNQILKPIEEKLIQSDSDQAFKKNVETELKAGKPKKQALAIAYSIKEKNRMKEDLNEAKEDEVINDIINKYSCDDIICGSMYLLPDGSLLDLGNSGTGHLDVCKQLINAGLEENNDPSKGSNLLRDKGWLRFNTALNFIDLKNMKLLTDQQYGKLKDIVDYMLKNNFKIQSVQLTGDNESKIYGNVDADYIVDRISKYFKFRKLYEDKENMDKRYFIVWDHFEPSELMYVKGSYEDANNYFGDDTQIIEIENFKPGLYFVQHNDEDGYIIDTGCKDKEEFFNKLREELGKMDLSTGLIELPILGWEIDFDLYEIDPDIDSIIDYVEDRIDNSFVDADSESAEDLIELSEEDFSEADETEEEPAYEDEKYKLSIMLDAKDILDRVDEEGCIYITDKDFPEDGLVKYKTRVKLLVKQEDDTCKAYIASFDGVPSFNKEHPEFEKFNKRFKLVDSQNTKESINESKEENLKNELKKAIRDYYSDFDEEDYEDFIADYLVVDVVPNDDMVKAEVRMEIGYDSFVDLIDEKLDPIVQKYDKDAYFEMEDAGIANAFLSKKSLNEAKEDPSTVIEAKWSPEADAYIIPKTEWEDWD